MARKQSDGARFRQFMREGDWREAYGRLGMTNMYRIQESWSPKEIDLGWEEEQEHSSDTGIIMHIVRDHLTQDPHYYSKLKKAGL